MTLKQFLNQGDNSQDDALFETSKRGRAERDMAWRKKGFEIEYKR